MTIEKIALGIATLALVLGGIAVFSGGGSSELAGNTSYQKQSFMEGFYAGTGRQFEVARTGALTTGANVTITTTNSATSSIEVGCIDTYATSTATAVRLSATTTPGIAYWTYGSCSGL